MASDSYFGMTATYSPEDNKLRLYSLSKLDTETYKRVREAGFIWAPKQELFVAPMWTPSREDLLIELCGEIGDEDTSLVERAEQRAERFEDYSDSRRQDADSAHKAVERITSGIPLGQPILVGHHSEKHARKDAERIENGMRKAIKMWEQAGYWKARAAGAVRAAKYKEHPPVRARRIKGLGTDLRREEKRRDEHQRFLTSWNHPGLSDLAAAKITNYDHVSACFTLDKYPRPEGASKYEGPMSLYSALGEKIITVQQAKELAVPVHERGIRSAERWIAHITNRLEYENAMLADAGATDLLKPKPRRELLPLCNYRAPEGLDIENIYNRGEKIHYPQVVMTQAEYTKIWTDYKATRVVGNSHRIRTAMQNHTLVCVFLADSKVHTPPAPKERVPKEIKMRDLQYTPKAPEPGAEKFDALKQQLKTGVQVAVAPQLFVTPRDIAAQMVELAEIEDGQEVLEPSAGTGVIVDAIRTAMASGEAGRCAITAVEINPTLAHRLAFLDCLGANRVHPTDFLECNGDLGKFDRVLMNPPFENGSDIKHIEHALKFLNPGGRLVAICADGPRQNEKLKPLAMDSGGTYLPLPEGTFKDSGTGVNTAMLVVMR